MKKFFNKVSNKMNSVVTRAKTALSNTKAEGYVDSGVKILIAVVIGALLLGILYTLLNTNIMPSVTSKISALFNYTGPTA